jgi:hypothetical protein
LNRLFKTLKSIVERPREETNEAPALPGFENRVEVLYKYAETAVAYEDDLVRNLEQIDGLMEGFRQMMEAAIDQGEDRQALEYMRLAARIRPQRELLDREIRSFHLVATDLIRRVTTLMDHIGEARDYARTARLSVEVTAYLDQAITRLTRYFVMLERVARARRANLPERLAGEINTVIDDRQLDLELATYILERRRALQSGDRPRLE